jgi:hypothetical protein
MKRTDSGRAISGRAMRAVRFGVLLRRAVCRRGFGCRRGRTRSSRPRACSQLRVLDRLHEAFEPIGVLRAASLDRLGGLVLRDSVTDALGCRFGEHRDLVFSDAFVAHSCESCHIPRYAARAALQAEQPADCAPQPIQDPVRRHATIRPDGAA